MRILKFICSTIFAVLTAGGMQSNVSAQGVEVLTKEEQVAYALLQAMLSSVEVVTEVEGCPDRAYLVDMLVTPISLDGRNGRPRPGGIYRARIDRLHLEVASMRFKRNGSSLISVESDEEGIIEPVVISGLNTLGGGARFYRFGEMMEARVGIATNGGEFIGNVTKNFWRHIDDTDASIWRIKDAGFDNMRGKGGKQYPKPKWHQISDYVRDKGDRDGGSINIKTTKIAPAGDTGCMIELSAIVTNDASGFQIDYSDDNHIKVSSPGRPRTNAN